MSKIINIEGSKYGLNEKDVKLIKKEYKKNGDKDLWFFTSCCGHCGLTGGGCTTNYDCMCHDEQVAEIKRKVLNIDEDDEVMDMVNEEIQAHRKEKATKIKELKLDE